MGIIAGNQSCFFGFISQSAPKLPKFKSEQTIIINSVWIFIPQGMSQPLSISPFLYRLGCQLAQRVQMLSTNLGNNSPSSVIHLGKNTSSAPFKSACTLVIMARTQTKFYFYFSNGPAIILAINPPTVRLRLKF